MARSLTPDRQRASIAVLAIAAVVLLSSAIGQVLAIGLGVVGGLLLCRQDAGNAMSPVHFPVSRRAGWSSLALFAVLLLGLPLLAAGAQIPGLSLFDGFYRAGALVFGDGHAVLPLLETETETVARGWVSRDAFMAGYGATQAMPGPLFTFAAYLGAVAQGWGGAAIALVGVFLPGLLLLVGVLPFWNIVRARSPGPRRACAAPMPLSSACWGRLSTIRCLSPPC
jgi:chromate transporter